MKHYHLLGVLCLFLLVQTCFAQRSVEPSKGYFGLFSEHYLAKEIVAPPFSKGYAIHPLRHQVGLRGERLIGQHFGLGLSLSYYYRQGDGFDNTLYRTGFFYPSPEDRVYSFQHHLGNLNLAARWYLQKPTSALRAYGQFRFATLLQYAGRIANPYHSTLEQRAFRPLGFYFACAYSLGLGGGIQYRLGDKWGLETALMFDLPLGKHQQALSFMQYGLQLGVSRMIF